MMALRRYILSTVFMFMCVTCVEPFWNFAFYHDASVIFIFKDISPTPLISSILHGFLPSTKKNCSSDQENFCNDYGSHRLTIKKDFQCLKKSILSTEPEIVGPEVAVTTVINYSGHLYGGPEQIHQYWPLNKFSFNNYSYVTKQADNQAIAERYWLSSSGRFYYIAPETPLFITQNQTSLTFISNNTAPYPSPKLLNHSYTVCELENARVAHMFAVHNVLNKPSDIPDERMVQKPIWSTWAKYKKLINETTVLKFADEIIEHGFNNSQIEIDDFWETCYGSLTFDPTKFPDMPKLSSVLKEKGYRITLWVHPFINTNCTPYHEEALSKGYFVRNAENDTKVQWWNGEASAIDFTNPEAVAWWTERLEKLRTDSGIDSFKFDAGESSFLPQVPVLTGDISVQPNLYSQKYVEAASKFGKMIEVRVGFQTQQYPVFVRMLDKDSVWDFQNGLRTLVTTLLQMNMVGYPFVLPDMVGGNGYVEAPSKELFIRWLQANVFMPAIQYSYVPWDYDDETVEICKKYTDLHEQYADKIIEAMRNASKFGTPVNPPIWWIAPEDETAQTVDDEFLLGADLLVAPVMEQNATARDIYLPAGMWHDKLRNTFVQGPTWLRNYTATLSELPYFELNNGTEMASLPETASYTSANSAGRISMKVLCFVIFVASLVQSF